MMRTVHRRWWLWGVLFCVALWLALFGHETASDGGPAIAVPTTRTVGAAMAKPVSRRADRSDDSLSSEAMLDGLIPRNELMGPHMDARQRDLFATRSWTPAPPPPQRVASAPPMAPPLPYTYHGKKLEAGVWEVFLGRGESNFIVREGSSLENAYVIEKVEPPVMRLRYRPLDEVQTMAIGAAQ